MAAELKTVKHESPMMRERNKPRLIHSKKNLSLDKHHPPTASDICGSLHRAHAMHLQMPTLQTVTRNWWSNMRSKLSMNLSLNPGSACAFPNPSPLWYHTTAPSSTEETEEKANSKERHLSHNSSRQILSSNFREMDEGVHQQGCLVG